MAANSVTGSGHGVSGKPTTNELASFTYGPNILLAGRIELTAIDVSPPIAGTNTVTLPQPLPESASHYVVMATGINTGSVYLSSMENNADGKFYRFTLVAENEGTGMYIIVKAGIRPGS